MEKATTTAPGHQGSLVAFEGPSDTVLTQLRLLPNSPKILILPALQSFIKSQDSEAAFDPRAYVLKIHEACKARAEMAHSFLRDSTPNNKRLVFFNGGTIGAQMDCITTICQRETEGDFQKAEAMYCELVKNGVAGLRRAPASQDNSLSHEKFAVEEEHDLPDDPRSKAMRAADALDRQTAALQPDTEIDLTIKVRPRSESLPNRRRSSDHFEASAPFYVFGASSRSEPAPSANPAREQLSSRFDAIRTWLEDTPGRPQDEPPTVPSSNDLLGADLNIPTGASSSSGDILGATSLALGSMPNSPGVIYGHAQVVDIRTSPTIGRSTRRETIKSLDSMYATAIRNQDIALCSSGFQPLTPISPANPGLRSQSVPLGEAAERLLGRPKYLSEIPRATFVKPSKTIIRRRTPYPLNLANWDQSQRSIAYVDSSTSPVVAVKQYENKSTWTNPCYVSRGVDAAHFETAVEDDFELDTNCPFETALAIVEDLVVHFQDETPDALLESMIQSFKDGTYPVSMPPLLPVHEDDSDAPGTPKSRSSAPSTERPRASPAIQHESAGGFHAEDDYDPFASHGSYLQPATSVTSWASKGDFHEADSTALHQRPPTPAQTPPPPPSTNAATAIDTTFHALPTSGCRTAVCVQNTLRSILNIYFSPDGNGYNQFSFPQLPELSRLWKPVFRDADPGTSREERKIDLILAVGAQNGVKKEFLSAISGSIEKLGSKPSGITRSGRLDLRYLIAHAMQAFTAQPLANQTQDNLFTNPLLLATLIIPHLETYLAAHSETRLLLLEYPPEHLSTVLALQRLVGVSLLKVAGILTCESADTKSSTRFGRPPLSHKNTPSSASRSSSASSRKTATLFAPNGAKSLESPSFSKANFLITSSATESEIATLISTIWKILIDISPFYIPDGAPRPSISYRASSDNIRNSRDRMFEGSPFASAAPDYAPFTTAAIMMGFQSPPESPRQKSVLEEPKATKPASPTLASAPPPPVPDSPQRLVSSGASIAETVVSTKTARSNRSKNAKLAKMLGVDPDIDPRSLRPDTQSSYFDVSDDDEGQFAADERRYMPMFLKAPGATKGNSRKALKWLGLA